MRSAIRWSWFTASVAVIGVLVIGGIVFSGCSPATQEPSGPGGASGPEISGGPAPSEEPAAPAGDKPAEETTSEPAEPVSPAAELPPAPAVSTFAPAADLVAGVQYYLEELEEAVETEEEYNDSVEKIGKQSNTLILVALALGLHDTDHQLKAAAPAMLKAAQQLAAAKDYAATKESVAALKAATSSTEGDPAGLKWEKLASLREVMEAVPLLNTRLKRYIRDGREEKMKDAADDLASYAAVVAVIAQGSMPNTDETEQPTEVEKWHAFCVQMRDAAMTLNQGIRSFASEGTPDAFEAAKAGLKELAQSCDDCHAVFHPDAETKQAEEAE